MSLVTEHRPRTGRNTELALLVLSIVIGWACYTMAGIGASGGKQIPTDAVRYGIGLAVITGAMHVLIRWKATYADPVILPVATALNGIGLAMIHRIDLAKLARRSSHATMAPKQLMWAAIAVALACLLLYFLNDHRLLRRYTYITMVVSFTLLVLPLIPFLGKEINGARIWIGIGPLSFQPGELTKIALTIFFAGYLVTNRDQLALAGKKILGLQLPRGRDLGPILIAWGISVAILVAQSDLGTSLLFFGIFVALLYVATERVSWIVIGMSLFSLGATAAWQLFPHVQRRVDVWLNALDPEIYNRKVGGSGQVVQGLFGMANGGLLGKGLGQGSPQMVPYSESDFIYASLGEELGLVGLFAVLMMYVVLIERAFRTAIGVRDGFGKLLAAGLGFTIALQLFVVVGGVTRLIPLTGLTMPLVAYGGSSLVSNWIIVALLLRVSDGARRPASAAGPKTVEPDASAGMTQVVPMVEVTGSQTPERTPETETPSGKRQDPDQPTSPSTADLGDATQPVAQPYPSAPAPTPDPDPDPRPSSSEPDPDATAPHQQVEPDRAAGPDRRFSGPPYSPAPATQPSTQGRGSEGETRRARRSSNRPEDRGQPGEDFWRNS